MARPKKEKEKRKEKKKNALARNDDGVTNGDVTNGAGRKRKRKKKKKKRKNALAGSDDGVTNGACLAFLGDLDSWKKHMQNEL